MLRHLALGQQSVHGNNPPLKDEVAQQVQGHWDLIGLIIDRLLGKRQAYAMRERRQEMGTRGTLLLAAPQRLAVNGDGLRDRREARLLT